MSLLKTIFLKNQNEQQSTYSMDDFGNELKRIFLYQKDGSFVTEESSVRFSAVMASIRILAETAAGTHLHLYKSRKDGGKDKAVDHPLYDVLRHQANDEMTAFNFKEMMMTQTCLTGNSYAQKILNNRGEIIELVPIESKNVIVERDPKTKKIIYRVRSDNGAEYRFLFSQIFHVPGLGFDGIQGFSPIKMAMRSISLGLAAESFGDKFFKNGANVGTVLQYPNEMSDEAHKRLKADFDSQYTGVGNSHKAIILEEGATFARLGIPPEEAQFLETRKFQIEEIARIYRVPLHLLQSLERATNNNIEHQSLEFVQYTMLPWFERWEQAINFRLLTKEDRKKGYFAEFNMLSLLRGDNKSRSEALQVQRQNGIINADEWRSMENMNPQEGEHGNKYYINSAMVEVGTQSKGGDENK